MANAIVAKVSLELSGPEAWALHNALGSMSTSKWEDVGINADGRGALSSIFHALDETLKPRTD
jgi:hypothetical protein